MSETTHRALDDALMVGRELRRRIDEAYDLITPDGHCWVIDGYTEEESSHRAASCLLCHVRAVLRGEAAGWHETTRREATSE